MRIKHTTIILLCSLLCLTNQTSVAKQHKKNSNHPISESNANTTHNTISFNQLLLNIVQDGQWKGIAFINFDLFLKQDNNISFLQTKPYIIEDILTSKMTYLISQEDIKKPIPYSKIQHMLQQVIQSLIPGRLIDYIQINNFYVRLRRTKNERGHNLQ